uniref:Bestrophin homolog n=1 Tax=Heterorhabditis bacteriophora TaxID=37862 RepID=A0A1I7XBR1_HETBA
MKLRIVTWLVQPILASCGYSTYLMRRTGMSDAQKRLDDKLPVMYTLFSEEWDILAYIFLGNKYEMSPVYIDESDGDLDAYDRRRMGSAGKSFIGHASNSSTPMGNYSNQIVQEVAVSYSAPLTISPPLSPPLSIQIASGNKLDEYGNIKSSGSLQDYISDYDQRIISGERSHLESVERVNSKGRHETEFPVRIAFIGGDMVAPVHPVPIIPIEMPSYRGPTIDGRVSIQRITSGLGESVLSETTTIEELTTVTTTKLVIVSHILYIP